MIRGDTLLVLVNNLYNFASLGFGDFQLGQISEAASGGLSDVLRVLRTIAVVVSVLFGAFIVFMVLKRRELERPAEPDIVSQFSPPAPAPGGAMTARWGEILRHMDSAKESEWKLAVIEADKLVDGVLKRAGFPGDTLGERLMNISSDQLQALQGLWEAHKVRNRLAHELDYLLRYREAKHAIEGYARTLRELGAL